MLKKGILASLLVLLFAGAFAERRQVMLDKVVAVVGGSSILYSAAFQGFTDERGKGIR